MSTRPILDRTIFRRRARLMPRGQCQDNGVSNINELAPVHITYLKLLAGGSRVRALPSVSEQMAKNRLIQIRQFMHCDTTTQCVAEAIRRGIIE